MLSHVSETEQYPISCLHHIVYLLINGNMDCIHQNLNNASINIFIPVQVPLFNFGVVCLGVELLVISFSFWGKQQIFQ